MKFVKAECQKCHAPLEIDLDNLISKCPYCGGQYVIDSNKLVDVIKQKESTKQFALQKQSEIAIAKNEWKNKLFSGDAVGTIYLSCFFLIFLVLIICLTFFDHDALINQKLNRSESNIISYINKNKYDKALSEINKLDSYQSLSSKSDKKMWKEKREKYLELIQKQKREFDLSNPDNILAPISSKKVTGKTKDEA